MTNPLIYILYSCDVWKTWASMSLVVATGSPATLKKVLKKQVSAKNMEICSVDETLELSIEEINQRLEYGYIEVVRDGEVQ